MKYFLAALLLVQSSIGLSKGFLTQTIYEDRPITGTVIGDSIDIQYMENVAIAATYVANDGADTFDDGTAEVQTATFETKANTDHQDYIVFFDTTREDGWAIALTKPLKDIQTVTFDTKANTTAGDFIVITDVDGKAWGLAMDKTGSDDEPTATEWTDIAAGDKSHCDISGQTTAANVAAAAEACIDGVTGFSSEFATDDTAADGTMTFTTATKEPIDTAINPLSEDGSGTGSITVADTQDGVADTAPTPSNAWDDVLAARKSTCDISGDTSAADVAASVEVCVDALTDIGDVIATDDTAADGTMTFTQTYQRTVDLGVGYAADGSVAGVTWAQTTPAVASDVDAFNDTIEVTGHGWFTGTEGQASTGTTLPDGLSVSTDYYVIKVDDDSFKLATSYDNAFAGTAIALGDEGTGEHTFTPESTVAGTLKLQFSVDETNWVDIPSQSETISAAGSRGFVIENAGFRYLRTHATMGGDQGVFDIEFVAK